MEGRDHRQKKQLSCKISRWNLTRVQRGSVSSVMTRGLWHILNIVPNIRGSCVNWLFNLETKMGVIEPGSGSGPCRLPKPLVLSQSLSKDLLRPTIPT